MRKLAPPTAVMIGAIGIALVGAPAAAALPDCGTVAPWTMQCERGTHTSINTSPNVIVNNAPFNEYPALHPRYPFLRIRGFPLPLGASLSHPPPAPTRPRC